MNRYLSSDWARLRRVVGTRAGGVYGAGFALLVSYLLLSVPLGPASLGGTSVVANLLWVSFLVSCLLLVTGGWFMRRNWLAWSIKRNLLAELVVLAPVVLWWTVVGRPASFSFAANPVVTVFFITFSALLVTLVLSVVVLAIRLVVGFVRGHPDDEPAPEPAAPAETQSSAESMTDPPDASGDASTAGDDDPA